MGKLRAVVARVSTPRVYLPVAVVLVAAAVAAGLLVSGRGGRSPEATPAAAPTPTPTPTRHIVAGPLRSPFTGERVTSLGPVLAVKIDNIADARPPTGLTAADIVYLLPVEGGLSRILAVFSSHFPPVIGPVRSSREDDLELLRQFGRPAFAYSGAQPQLLPVVHRARIVDLYDGIAGGYFRDLNRIAPHNLYAHTRQLLAEAPGASTAHDIGFRFGPAPAGGTPTASVSASYPAASFTFRWSAGKARWLVWMDGAPAGTTEDGQLSAPTVVIQYTTVRTSRFLEEGVRPPYAESTGSGTALVLRDGKEWHAQWSRPNADGGTTFTTASGQPMTFARGQVWIVLAAR
jgi:Protein of unknown function (DUF3048) N-terminal domain/Protein of unknown function (DUF3048) C-terminal domain